MLIQDSSIDEYSEWLGVTEKFDAEEFIETAKNNDFHIVIVDHYGIGSLWESLIADEFDNLVVLDDLANRKHNAKLLVDQSIGRRRVSYSDLVPTNCTVLVGPKYALLREEFNLESKKVLKKFQILINFCGADKENYTMHILDILRKSKLSNDTSIKIVIGKDYPFRAQLVKITKNTDYRIELIENPKSLAEEIVECEIAIGAGGVSLLERSSLSVPSILSCSCQKSIHICDEYARLNLGCVIKRDEKDEGAKLISAIQKLLQKDELLKRAEANRILLI